MTEIDISELEPDTCIKDVDGFGKRLCENLAIHDIHRLEDVPTSDDTSESVDDDFLAETVDGIGSKRSHQLRQIATEVKQRMKTNTDSDSTPSWIRKSVSQNCTSVDGLHVALFASQHWNKKRPNYPPSSGETGRGLVTSVTEALTEVSSRRGERIARISFIDGSRDAPANAKHKAFRKAGNDLADALPYVLETRPRTPPWNDLPDCPEWKYGDDPTRHPEITRTENGLCWVKAPEVLKKELLSEADVAIHMDNYDYIRKDIKFAAKRRCELYIHEVEKHGTDDLDRLPPNVGTPSKDPHHDVNASFTRDKDRRAAGRDSEVTPRDYSEFPEVKDKAWKHFQWEPLDSDEARENPYLEQPATMNQQNRRDRDWAETFSGHERKAHKRSLSGNSTEVERDGTDDEDEERDSDIAEYSH